jgi:flagellar basal-body rod protein FlgF
VNVGIYQSAASLSALERWQDSVTQNISSSQLPGYRKRSTLFETEAAGQRQPVAGGQPDSGDPLQFPKAGNTVSFLPGEAQASGRELDVAIQGQGFFEVQTTGGQKAYTRDGEFQLRPDNTLVTASGEQVLNSGGAPITLLPTGGPLVINTDGSLMQGDTSIGKLSIVDFADTGSLQAAGGGTFLANGATPTPVAKPELLQGYLEGSNVSPMHEMVDLITISRAYESNQKVISTADQEMQKTLDALG